MQEVPKDRKKVYNKGFYDRNKCDLNEDKRKRYLKDPAYKDKVKAAAAMRYERQKKKRIPVDRQVVLAGEGQFFFTIGKLAKHLGKSVHTIRFYHHPLYRKDGTMARDRVIPEPTHADGRGWRLYTPAQVGLLKRVFTDFESGKIKSLIEVGEMIKVLWDGKIK